MQEFINNIIENLKYFESSSPEVLSVALGMTIIVLESMIPILPLAVFIALNIVLFGTIPGFLMSWIATSIGCLLSFTIVRKDLKKVIIKSQDESKSIHKLMKKIDKISFPNLVLIISLPFMPSFAINIAAGLSKMSFKKFMSAILISKIVIVYFWGFIGTTFIQSVTDITVIIKLGLLILIAYIISKQLMKKFKID